MSKNLGYTYLGETQQLMSKENLPWPNTAGEALLPDGRRTRKGVHEKSGRNNVRLLL